MRTIWKFPFVLGDNVIVEMPRGARVLKVEKQNGQNCIWALVNPESPKAPHHFFLRGTGHSVQDGIGEHIATWQDDRVVWHLFRGHVGGPSD